MTIDARIRAVQDQTLADGADTATVALSAGLVASVAHLVGGADDDQVAAQLAAPAFLAAMREVPMEIRMGMCDWIAKHWSEIGISAAVLDELDELESEPAPVAPAAAVAHRRAAQQVALEAGELCAVVAYVGAQAELRWLRLWGGRVLDTLDEVAAADPIVEAARRGLSEREKDRAVDFMLDRWVEIDNAASASERAS